jgi:serine phosphatase RsbU (regulator of sigma subunit)
MVRDATESRFCTLFCASVRPTANGVECCYVNGGHPAPLLLRADGKVEQVDDGRGPLVGVFETAEYVEATLRLHPDDVLLLYTDGVIELRSHAAGVGERELYATLAGCTGCSAEQVVAAVEQRTLELEEGQPRDDIALLALRPDPEASGGTAR